MIRSSSAAPLFPLLVLPCWARLWYLVRVEYFRDEMGPTNYGFEVRMTRPNEAEALEGGENAKEKRG
jgi:hypothetical protein